MTEHPRLESLLAHQPAIQSHTFLSGVVHDLNNGIGAVIAYAELLGMGPHSRQDLDQMLDDLMTAARRIADLSDAVSTLTRQDSSKKKPILVAKLVEQVVLVCQYRFQSRRIRLDVSVEGELEQPVPCYGNDLARAILYLLLNALENSEDAARKEVTLVASVAPGALTIRVHDRGPAFAPGEFDAALEPYATGKPVPHLGLGLTAVKAIADQHGGSLSYAPESGVTLEIPTTED